ncbi:hypothetical protein ACOMHN_038043 [Nucella lapillus]
MITMVDGEPVCNAFGDDSVANFKVTAIARCCVIPTLPCDYRQAGPSLFMADAMAEVTCPKGTSALGCTSISASKEPGGIVYSGDNPASCVGKNGPSLSQLPSTGVMTTGVCCHLDGMNCTAVRSSGYVMPNIFRSEVQCPPSHPVMTSCMAEGSGYLTEIKKKENASSSSGKERYSGYQVLEIRFHNDKDAASHLQELISKYKLDVWRRPFRGTVDVMVAPQQLDDVINFVENRKASYNVKVPDVQRWVEVVGLIRQFLRQAARANFSHADVSVASLGRSFGRRVTPYVTIRQKNSRDVNKKVIIIEAGMHAREWIAPAMAVNLIYKLTFNPKNDPDIDELLEKFDWIIVPITNPDGYIFSQRNISTRLWRKTRTSLYAHGFSECFGVDGNRNFGFEWTDDPDKGGSSNPCHDNYSGPQGFSEPETRNIRSLLLRLRSRLAVYISLHSFGQFFLYPWGYDSAAVLEDEQDMV